MKKLFVVCLVILFVLVGCQKERKISLDDVLSAFEQQGLHLEASEPMKHDTIFGAKLYGKKPKTYLLNNKLFHVFIYNSSTDRIEALNKFKEKTALMNLLSFSIYEKDNMLIFYVYEDHVINKNIEINDSIKEALNHLGD
ncbi:hypothetical protein P9B03_14120 [Metasolibacillus meyeri]|uniref:Lipoprotein n=1 Tax=Metasolibacillus meyeri TaxID=1071052 RepID=A0AAW9NPP1_9BACL|nr:hypothetical protein [Metasolibacillus meyeri]MEC1179632.1 hypothetical protein [Metasolibacillus meyeri]